MLPALPAGQIVLGLACSRLNVRPGQVVIVRHNGLEKVKRALRVDPLKGVFVVGDNAAASTDSRQFGWLMPEEVVAVIIWPRRSQT